MEKQEVQPLVPRAEHWRLAMVLEPAGLSFQCSRSV
ncbi:hypothetical protein SBC1_26680 [Caballeronia sp. SBC1]|nr:hypothetical protein SBC1_26680 [Caballeronia sp. SBC1]